MSTEQFNEAVNESLRQAQKDIDTFKEFINTPGWLRLMEFANSQIASRAEKVINRPDVQWNLAGESADLERGMIQGIRLFMQMPQLVTQYARDSILKLEKKDAPSNH